MKKNMTNVTYLVFIILGLLSFSKSIGLNDVKSRVVLKPNSKEGKKMENIN